MKMNKLHENNIVLLVYGKFSVVIIRNAVICNLYLSFVLSNTS